MEKDQPPPYSAATGTHTLPGFGVPPPPSSQPQPYPPEHGHPQSYPQQHGPQPYPSQHGLQPHPTQPGHPQPGYPQPGYPQPQHPYGAPPMQMPGSTTVIVTAASVVPAYGPHPQPMTCPHCHQQMTTRIETEASLRTHTIALLCCIMGCIPCCLLPYFMDSCLTKNHYCPHCEAFLGNYNSDPGMYRRW